MISALLLAATIAGAIEVGPPVLVTQIFDEAITEASGMAISRVDPDRIWLINDNQNPATLFAVDRQGHTLAALDIEGRENRDWEALDSFELDGEPWLVIGDIGDNRGVWDSVSLLFVREPETLPAESLPVDRVLEFTLPGGPTDAESVAVDPTAGWIYVATKREYPPRLLRLPLDADGTVIEAEAIHPITTIPQPTEADLQDPWPRMPYSSQPTDMAISPDGRTLVLLTYRRLCVWQRSADETWAKVLAEPPQMITLPRMTQTEALTFTADGRALLLTSEHWPAPIVEFEIFNP